MNARFLVAMGALVALAAVFAACGDDDDGGGSGGGQVANIRTEKGISLAALEVMQNTGAEDDSARSSGLVGNAAGAAESDGAAPAAGIASTGKLGYDAAYPAQQTAGGGGITVIGYATATADADSAVIELYFGSYTDYSDKPVPFPEPVPDSAGGSGSSGSDSVAPDVSPLPGDVDPITEADLQPVIDALVNAGVARDDIEFVDQGYYDPYYASATLRVTLANLDSVDAVVQAGTDAGNTLDGITSQGSNVTYAVSDCAPVEQAALAAAVEDAADHLQPFADALGVTAGGIIGASNFSYSYSADPCQSGYYGPYYPADVRLGSGGPAQVQVFANISVTYAIQ